MVDHRSLRSTSRRAMAPDRRQKMLMRATSLRRGRRITSWDTQPLPARQRKPFSPCSSSVVDLDPSRRDGGEVAIQQTPTRFCTPRRLVLAGRRRSARTFMRHPITSPRAGCNDVHSPGWLPLRPLDVGLQDSLQVTYERLGDARFDCPRPSLPSLLGPSHCVQLHDRQGCRFVLLLLPHNAARLVVGIACRPCHAACYVLRGSAISQPFHADAFSRSDAECQRYPLPNAVLVYAQSARLGTLKLSAIRHRVSPTYLATRHPHRM
ncbi:hypothetical protein FA95DRAFT_647893 [Auriscalpium vulgare]|uniref:Uncharacterized protein n=1 Tax=Auriscalpium vulgare TaxID=40419 RepID=A0ACB8RDV6_9AGAM|nr:hypothetical protein FA95DRAFT_647893 [Auriscalpium vulgare]